MSNCVRMFCAVAMLLPTIGLAELETSHVIRELSEEERDEFREVRRITNLIWDSRMKIREGRVVLRTRCLADFSDPSCASAVNTREIVFRGEYLFVKRTRTQLGRDHTYYVILGPGFSYDMQSREYPVNVNYAEPLQVPDARVFHPRTLGLFASGLSTYYVFHEHADTVGVSGDVSVIAARENETDAAGNELLYVRAESRLPDSDMVAEYWYSINQQYMPNRIVVSTDAGRDVDQILVSLGEVETATGVVFFPKLIDYSRRKDDVLLNHEVTEVVEADFRRPVGDAVFTLDSFDTGVRAEAFVDRQMIRPIVDGKIADSYELDREAMVEGRGVLSGGANSRRGWLLLINTLLAAGVFVWLVLRRARWRQSS